MDRVKHMYDAYFRMLRDLWDDGWYEEHPGCRDLDWLRRRYPMGAREESRGRADPERRPDPEGRRD